MDTHDCAQMYLDVRDACVTCIRFRMIVDYARACVCTIARDCADTRTCARLRSNIRTREGERERERERAFVGGEEREPAQGETEVFELPKSSNLEPSKCVVLFY